MVDCEWKLEILVYRGMSMFGDSADRCGTNRFRKNGQDSTIANIIFAPRAMFLQHEQLELLDALNIIGH